MARKSRKQIAVEEPIIESVSSEVFSTAIYARLSVENSGKSEKVDVIANQIEICKSYIAERPYSPYMTQNLPEEFYDTGYVSLVSVNNETKYRNFRIKALPEPEKEGYKDFAPVPEADRDDALSKLAGEVKDKDALFEREGKVNPDLVYTSEISRYIESGCSGRIGGSVCLVSAVALCGIVLYNRKR